VVFTLAAVVILGLAAGLVVWAPWTPPPPPVLRPAGLVAGPSTTSSIAFRWSRPRTGPLPDRYLILNGGTVAGSVAGTVTSYRHAGLNPATAYQYRVVAVRGGKRSPQSALLTVRTLTPPISQARLQGQWNLYAKNVGHVPGGRNGSLFWQVNPVCLTGACDVIVHVRDGRYSFKVKLARAGAVYRGHTVLGFSRCGSRANSIADPTTVTIRIHVVTAATGANQEWAATSLAGRMTASSKYVSSATFYCTALTVKTILTGTAA
jgi:hypothetical protein